MSGLLPRPAGRRAVFLDRDGTLNADTGYPNRPEDVRLLDGVVEGAKRLADGGFELLIVSNQSGIARGFMTSEEADEVDRRVQALLAASGVTVLASYRCPHLPNGSVAAYAIECDCRKPRPGLLLRAAAEYGLDLPASWAVGDSERDVEAGLAAGCRAVLLGDRPAGSRPRGLYLAKNLPEAAGIILTTL